MRKDGAQSQETKCILQTSEGGKLEIATFKDTDTGVEYVIVSKDNLTGVAVAICPRYKADGTFFTGK